MKVTLDATVECDQAGCTRTTKAKITTRKRRAPQLGELLEVSGITLDNKDWWHKPGGSHLVALCAEHKSLVEKP